MLRLCLRRPPWPEAWPEAWPVGGDEPRSVKWQAHAGLGFTSKWGGFGARSEGTRVPFE